MMEHQNYCSLENGIKVCNVSSTLPNCSVENILIAERKQIWMSLEGLPQYITLDLRQMQERPKFIKCFGFDCWHDYSSNPSVIELLISPDPESFITWTTLYPELKQGIQLFQIDPIGKRYTYLKIIIKETFGASKTYLNQIFLLEEYAMITTESVSESHLPTEHNSSQYRQQYNEEQEKQLDQNKIQNEQYQVLAQQIQNMGREVASLKQSHSMGKQPQKIQTPPFQQTLQSFQQKPKYSMEEQTPPPPTDTYKLTSTERIVMDLQNKYQIELNGLRKEIQEWKLKNEGQENQIGKLSKQLQSIIERQNDQEEQMQKVFQQNQSELSFQQNQKKQYQSNPNIKYEEQMEKRIQELTNNYQNLLEQQENKYKEQQKSLVQKFKSLIKQEQKQKQELKQTSKSRSRPKHKSPSQSSNQSLISSKSSSESSILEFIRSKRPQKSKSRQNSKQRTKSLKRSISPGELKESNKLEQNKQKKVAALVGKLKDKLQQRGQIAEKLNLSQRKTKRLKSLQNLSEDSLSSDY